MFTVIENCKCDCMNCSASLKCLPIKTNKHNYLRTIKYNDVIALMFKHNICLILGKIQLKLISAF